MDGFIFGSIERPSSSNTLDLWANLVLFQKQALPSHGIYMLSKKYIDNSTNSASNSSATEDETIPTDPVKAFQLEIQQTGFYSNFSLAMNE